MKLLNRVLSNPNSLTKKTIKDAHEGKGIGKPIENIRAFIDAL